VIVCLWTDIRVIVVTAGGKSTANDYSCFVQSSNDLFVDGQENGGRAFSELVDVLSGVEDRICASMCCLFVGVG